MKKPLNQRFSLLFITLPQALLAAALFYAYRSTELVPSLPLIVIFSAQAAVNLFVIVSAVLDLKGKHILTVQLAGLIAAASAALPFLLEQFDFATSLSPEAIYGTLCLIPLIYLAAAILRRGEIPPMPVKTRIILCVCVPLGFAIIPFLGMGLSYNSFFSDIFDWVYEADWLESAASVLFILLFALFFVFVCLVTSILYHYRVKKAALQEDSETQENPAGKKRSDRKSVV